MRLLKHFMIFSALLISCTLSWAKENDYIMSDDEIIAYLNEINHHEIKEAELALKKNVSPTVKDYADMMINDHKQSLSDTTALIEDTHIQPIETYKVKEFKRKGMKELDNISNLDGQSFQMAYVDNMIKGHKEALLFLEKAIKDARNNSLKDYLKKVHQTVSMHLKHAEKLPE